MKTRNLWLLVPVVALAVGYISWEPLDRERHHGMRSDTGATDAVASNVALPAAKNPEPAVAAAGRQHDIAAAAQADCDLHVDYLPVGDGTVSRAFSCEPRTAPERHPYESYSSAALESLAYADAEAAAVLGMRLRDTDEAKAMSLMLRASALTGGDTTPILRYSNAYTHPVSVDGVPVRKTVHTKFVLSAVADLLSDDTNYAAQWEDIIRHYSSDPDTEIAMLQAKARQIVEEMRQIQLGVSGFSEIGGQGDA